MKRYSVFLLVCLVASLFLFAPTEARPKKIAGAQLFQQHCAKCHTEGGNIVKPNRPVAESKQLASLVLFKAYLSAPPGHMPYYQNIVKDPKTLSALYNYCKTLKRKPVKQAMLQSTPFQ
jgi:mono/diheme cytochrome c family protein